MTDLVERLRSPYGSYSELEAEAADEIERLREMFRVDGEQHAAHIKGFLEQHETRMAAYANEIERLRAENILLKEGVREFRNSLEVAQGKANAANNKYLKIWCQTRLAECKEMLK